MTVITDEKEIARMRAKLCNGVWIISNPRRRPSSATGSPQPESDSSQDDPLAFQRKAAQEYREAVLASRPGKASPEKEPPRS